MRKTFLPALILAGSALAGAGIAATAAPATEAGPPPAMMDGPGRHHHFMRHRDWEPIKHLEGRLAFLKAELKIKSSQEDAWSDFAAASRKSAKIIEDARPGKGEGEGKEGRDMAVPDRLDRAEKRLNTRLDALKTIKGPATKLYDSLDDSQKQMADELMMRPMGLR